MSRTSFITMMGRQTTKRNRRRTMHRLRLTLNGPLYRTRYIIVTHSRIRNTTNSFTIIRLQRVLFRRQYSEDTKVNIRMANIALIIRQHVHVARRRIMPIQVTIPTPIRMRVRIRTNLRQLVKTPPFNGRYYLKRFKTSSQRSMLPNTSNRELTIIIIFSRTINRIRTRTIYPTKRPRTRSIRRHLTNNRYFKTRYKLLP